MIGYPDGTDAEASIGHFTSGGTVANFEAALRARNRLSSWLAAGAADPDSKLTLFEASHQGWGRFRTASDRQGDRVRVFDLGATNPWEAGRLISERYRVDFRGPVLLVPENKHYSWKKSVSLLGLGEESFWPVALDAEGRLSVTALESRLAEAERTQRPVLMVVSVAGTTELGVLDPVDRVQDLLDGLARERGIHIWHHVDAAYGGFLCSMQTDDSGLLGPTQRRALSAIRRANSVTLDPHKLGYVPYACGAYIGKELQDWITRTFDGPYLQFDAARDKGQHTLEG
jgi:glutamate/tyrosine decarboxylase-like PLP-dependent enzyme